MSSKRGKEQTAKRQSTRTVVVSKAFRVVDSETRKEFRDKRIQTLEADNYVENEVNAEDDDAYDEDEVEKRAPQKKKRKSGTSSTISKWILQKPKPLDRIIFEQGYETNDPAAGPNYLTVRAGPSTIPARRFCSVCGQNSDYNCTRCGQRYCSMRCNAHHKETRCMKLSY